MGEWTKRQVAIAAVVSLMIGYVATAAAVDWIGDMWSARQTVYQSDEARCKDPDKDCAEKDLPAQVRAAAAAEAMVDISIWQLVVGGAGLVAVVASLVISAQTVRAAYSQVVIAEQSAAAGLEHAQRALEASNASAQKQLDTMRAQTRAILTFTEPEAFDRIENGETKTFFRLIYKNIGATAALEVKVGGGLVAGPGVDEITFDWSVNPQRGRPIPPEREMTTRERPLTKAQIDQIMAGTLDCVLVGRLDYRDIFGEPHHAQEALRMRVHRIPGKLGAVQISYEDFPGYASES